MTPALHHYSETAGIARFEPRPVRVPSPRPPGRDWLNGPLVWAIEAAFAPLYLFPRDCPRILLWRTETSGETDARRWMPDPRARMAAFVEARWLDRLRSARLVRYSLPSDGFEPLDDAGMHVSRTAVMPLGADAVSDLPAALAAEGVTLTALPDLTPLRGVWDSSLHASGIRLRNAQGWQGA